MLGRQICGTGQLSTFERFNVGVSSFSPGLHWFLTGFANLLPWVQVGRCTFLTMGASPYVCGAGDRLAGDQGLLVTDPNSGRWSVTVIFLVR